MGVRRLTLSEIVVSAAVVGLFGAVLYPILAQARSASRHDLFAANLKTLTASTLQYTEDSDGVLPMAFVQEPDGSWHWNQRVTIPAGWNPYRLWNGDEWPNSVQAYFLDWSLLEFPGLPKVHSFLDIDYKQANFKWANAAVGYNGLLHGYPLAMVAAPDSLTMIWTNHGSVNQEGYVVPSPSLYCSAPGPCRYVPASSECSTSHNGEQSALFGSDGSSWIDKRSAYFASADGHVRAVEVGTVFAPGDTDLRLDPYTGYDANGLPYSYWWDGCHVWLFRPDYDFSD